MKFKYQNASPNDVVQTSAQYGSYSEEKQVKMVQRSALTIITAAASAGSGYNVRTGDGWTKKLRAEFESMTVHLVNSVEGKRRTYSTSDVFYAFMIGNALQLADSTLHGIKEYIKAGTDYKVNNVTAAAQIVQQLDSEITFVEGLLDSFPVSPWVKQLIKLTGYYPGNKNHTPCVFLVDEIGLWKDGKAFTENSDECGSYYLSVDIAQETDASRLVTQVDTLVDKVTELLSNSIREAAADLISYGKGSLKGIKCSGIGAAYDKMRKLVCNSVGGYARDGGFDVDNDGTYYYDELGVKWASVMIGYSQDHARLRDAITSVVGESDGTGIESDTMMAVPFGYFNLLESTSTGTVEGYIVSLIFTKWSKHLSDEGQIWVWFNDRIDLDRFTDWDEASTNLPILITNITSGLRDGFNLSYDAGATGRQACYFSTLADAEFVYYPVRLLDFAKDEHSNMVATYCHIDTEKLRQEKKPSNKKDQKPTKQDGDKGNDQNNQGTK